MRNTTKQNKATSRTRIVKGKLSIITNGDYNIWSKGDIEIRTPKKIIENGQDDGVVYKKYIAPEKGFDNHPNISKIEFVDEEEQVLNQNTSNFFYGQKLKIRITTENTKDGELISFELQAKSKSKNQPFDQLNTSKYRWTQQPVINNQVESDFFVLNPNWYSDDFEKYNPNTYETEIKEDDLNEFFVKATLGSKKVYLPVAGERLKPITYKRNYEELIGLFQTNESKNKDLLENYENYFINKYSDKNEEIKELVDDFSEWLCEENPEATISEIKAKVQDSSNKLWESAIWQNQDHINTRTTINKATGERKDQKRNRDKILDDRPLYWARIAMQVILKRQYVFIKDILTLPEDQQDLFFKKSIVPSASKLAEVLKIFEVNSRNYAGINFNACGVTNIKKLLITGFDPFFLDPNTTWGNPLQANPSGISALSLNGQIIGEYCIQTLICPVRYSDFDEFSDGLGIIEKYIKPFINHVDMIITMSQGHPFRFDVDRFSCKNRKGTPDNLNWDKKNPNFKQLSFGNEFYETTLPYKKIVPEKNDPKDTFWIYFNQTYSTNWKKYFDNEQEGTELIEDSFTAEIHDQFFIKNFQELKTYHSESGSGGNYLSNEIFYRVSKLRSEMRPNLPTGHLHLPLIQGNDYLPKVRGNNVTKDINPKIDELIEKITKIISKI